MLSSLAKALCVPALALAGAWISPAAAQDLLPPGPGRAETLKACGGCHGVDTFLGIRRTQGEWETTLVNMINFGMTISDADYDTVLAYLTAYFGPTPRPRIPGPRAPAVSP